MICNGLFTSNLTSPFFFVCAISAVPESESDSEVDESHEGTTILKLDDWVVFKLDSEAAQLILHLRQKWNALFLRRMKVPSKAMTQQDEQVVKTLVSVITCEEQACGLQQPLGIGQRPRPLLVDYYPANARRAEDFEEVPLLLLILRQLITERKLITCHFFKFTLMYINNVFELVAVINFVYIRSNIT